MVKQSKKREMPVDRKVKTKELSLFMPVNLFNTWRFGAIGRFYGDDQQPKWKPFHDS